MGVQSFKPGDKVVITYSGTVVTVTKVIVNGSDTTVVVETRFGKVMYLKPGNIRAVRE